MIFLCSPKVPWKEHILFWAIEYLKAGLKLEKIFDLKLYMQLSAAAMVCAKNTLQAYPTKKRIPHKFQCEFL